MGSKIYVRNYHRSAPLNFSWVPLIYIPSTEHHELKNQNQRVLAKEKAFLVFKLHCYRSPGGLKVKVAQSCPTLWDPMDYTVHGILPARILEWVAVPFSRGSFQPRDRTQVSLIAVDSLPAEPPGKPKNTGVGSLSLLQGIFLTQESNQGLLHCRWILSQLSYEGSQEVYLHLDLSCCRTCPKGGCRAWVSQSFRPCGLWTSRRT